MYNKILVPTDGSATAAKAIAPAVQLAKQCGAALVGVTVTDPYPYSGLAESVPITADEYRVSVTKAAEAALSPLVDACKAAGLACDCVVSENIHPWKAMLEVAQEKSCDLVVMASHGRRGMQSLLLGSETQKLLTHSHLPVLVVR
ncbi:MAG: universal stress protein [Betaproteobacteria bacterium]|jgi:nucleotide-binding universal stress UspA family protein|uniref:Putative universal stress protein (UspA family) n=1 Tax=Thiomonas delicata TaxID=364030 RepID=A0A238D9V4_THIDL|nr:MULTISPECIES: universal stress protein [Thiomonas]MDE2128942.1 universal stress protein [Betaproteobacteria bacterium]OZB46323.1 MAG: universal stress protein UspA [Thiomonas sp. 15-66-11]OZB64664.1 MAG: universal stress protein UspA [Thiomonas sp. 13-66-29]SBP89950.1 putative universal stress protein (UspA family) [Thiomonas delicata]